MSFKKHMLLHNDNPKTIQKKAPPSEIAKLAMKGRLPYLTLQCSADHPIMLDKRTRISRRDMAKMRSTKFQEMYNEKDLNAHAYITFVLHGPRLAFRVSVLPHRAPMIGHVRH
jgi:hypothetical protein